MSVGRHIEIRGVVQGVGFRPWVYNLARTAGLTGTVSNDAAGVVIEAFASSEADLDAFLNRLRNELPPAARIEAISWANIERPEKPASFEIAPSSAGSESSRRPSIPADLATCEACAREIADPSDRRYRYAFTSCTHCGPRFTIALDVPYDRVTTTMMRVPMCPDCRREYEDPNDRRFHAQPNACPRCGPSLRLTGADGEEIEGAGEDPIARAAGLIAKGKIVAIKGLGGWHLACDATNEESVRELRRRKHRDEKPLAVMVRDAKTAARLVAMGESERALLESPSHPIVIMDRLDGRRTPSPPIVNDVAPESRRLGLMLPYTPLHHVLMGDAERPLVMTSGNLSDEPIATDNDDAFERLALIADAFLVHDRDIASRADDSVAIVALGKPVVTRRSRGFVPERIPLSSPLARPTLACGAHLKNTFCLGSGDAAYFGPHIGDLDNVAAYDGYERAIERMERFLRVKPEVVAHDMHPGYLSTRYALGRLGVQHVAVQHHHAHVVSALAEHGVEGPVIGVAFDGTGYGTDGTAWGGEVLVADAARFERVASLRCVRLAGGDRAIREVWRVALALLDDAFEGDAPVDRLALFDTIPRPEIVVVRKMIEHEVNAPLASGAGRYFDAFGALGLARPRASFEGQIAMAWEQIADPSETRPYPFRVDGAQTPWRVDLRGTLRAAVEDLLGGRAPATIAARFHATLVAATTDVVWSVVRERGRMPVVLTGGCFQNVRLTESLARALGDALSIYVHGRVPPGDGGIALGQLLVANALASEGGV